MTPQELKALIEERFKLWEKAKKLNDLAESEKRSLTPVEQKSWDKMSDDLAAMTKTIDRVKLVHDTEKRMAAIEDPLRNAVPATARPGVPQALQGRGWCEQRSIKPEDLDNLDDGKFQGGISEFLFHIRNATTGRFDRRLEPFLCETRAGQDGVTGGGGGFFLPERIEAEVLMSVDRDASWLGRRRVIRIRDADSVTFPAIDDSDRSSNEVAGLALTRVGEGSTLTEDQVLTTKVNLKLHKAGKLIPISNELLSDSAVALRPFLSNMFGRAVALLQARDHFEGSGSGEGLGIWNGSDLHTASTVSAAGAIKVDDLAEMVSRLEPGGGDSAAWICHPGVLKAMMLTVAGADTTPVWLANAPGLDRGALQPLFGFPVFASDACKTLDTQGDINLCNLNAYIYFLGRTAIEASSHAQFESDKTVFRIVLRDAGQPWRGSTLADRQSFIQSNFVRLTTRV